MFDKLTQPDDMFAQTDQSAPQPTPPTQPSEPSLAPPVSSIVESRVSELAAHQSSGGGIKTAVIILAIIVVIGAAFLISWRILSSRTPVTPAAPGEKMEETQKIPVEEELQEEVVIPEPEPEPVVEADSDQDGLTDARESELGTNSLSSDTDGDGLFDREEAEVYLTDPLKADTDGDTFGDGAEVKAGYNPKGPGKLLEVPAGS